MNSRCIEDFAVRLRRLEHYSEMVETFLASEAAALEARVVAGMNEHPPSDRQDYFEAFLDDILEVSEDLPSLLRFSLVTALDSAVEQLLVCSCQSYAKLMGLTLAQGDIRGSTLERTRRYLKEIVRVPFPDHTQDWVHILRFRDLRNAIVHRDGTVDAAGQPLRQWLLTQPGITLKGGHTIALAASFIGHAIAVCNSFSHDLDAAFGVRPLMAFETGFEVEEATPPQSSSDLTGQ
jgi:hypothetical protein